MVVLSEIDGSTSIIRHMPALCADEHALYDQLIALPAAAWIQGSFMGNRVPRTVRWHAPGSYKFGGRKWPPMPYSAEMSAFQARLVAKLGASRTAHAVSFKGINSVLVNRYRDNMDSISPHADNEPEFGAHPTIVSVNFGAPRTFVLSRMTEKRRAKEWRKAGKEWVPNPRFKQQKFTFELAHGDVLVMAGATQDFWLHRVNKEPNRGTAECVRKRDALPTTVRFNLTFRPYVVQPGAAKRAPSQSSVPVHERPSKKAKLAAAEQKEQ